MFVGVRTTSSLYPAGQPPLDESREPAAHASREPGTIRIECRRRRSVSSERYPPCGSVWTTFGRLSAIERRGSFHGSAPESAHVTGSRRGRIYLRLWQRGYPTMTLVRCI